MLVIVFISHLLLSLLHYYQNKLYYFTMVLKQNYFCLAIAIDVY